MYNIYDMRYSITYKHTFATALLLLGTLFFGQTKAQAQEYPAYWDVNQSYYIEFTDYNPESSIYGKYLYDNGWTLKRGDATNAQKWYIIPKENGYIVRRADNSQYLSMTSDRPYYHFQNSESEAFLFTELEHTVIGTTTAFALSAPDELYNGSPYYLNAHTWVAEADQRTEEDKIDLKRVKSYFRLVTITNNNVENFSVQVPKTIQHRIHHSVLDAKRFAAEKPEGVYRGLMSGEKEWIDNGYGKQMQYCATYEITRYVDPNDWTTCFLPMIQYGSLIVHRSYQRFYDYRTDGLFDASMIDFGRAANNMVTYDNGYVTGVNIKGHTDDGNAADNATNFVNASVDVKLPTGVEEFDLACDLSDNIFGDMEKDNDGDVTTEPSLTQRVVWHIKSGRIIADRLRNLGDGEWLHDIEIHFPYRSVNFEPDVIALDHEFGNYWFYDARGNLRNIRDDNSEIDITLDDKGTGISLLHGQKDGKSTITGDNKGIYKNPNRSYRGSRFIAFVYPQPANANGWGVVNSAENPAVVEVRIGGYNVARFKLYFDEGSSTLPWDEVLNGTSNRSPNALKRRTNNDPIAAVTFDYPIGKDEYVFEEGDEYEQVNQGIQNQSYATHRTVRRFLASKWPLEFSTANYIHYFKHTSTHRHASNGDYYDCKFGEYMLTSQTSFWNALGPFLGVNNYSAVPDLNGYIGTGTYQRKSIPDEERWYPAKGFRQGFLYVDASERAGMVTQIPFNGTFCSGNKMMCSGWMTSGAAYGWAGQSPASVVISVIGRDYNDDGSIKNEKVLHRFCPGNLSLDVRYSDGHTYMAADPPGNSWVDDHYRWKNTDETGPWQQFYFEFSIDTQFEQYFIEINNNCVNTSGGDFMLDDIQIYAALPKLEIDEKVPLCIRKDKTADADLLKVSMDFDTQLLVTGQKEATAETTEPMYITFAFLEKNVFLSTFRQAAGLDASMSLNAVEEGLMAGKYEHPDFFEPYKTAFYAALVGDHPDGAVNRVWDSEDPNNPDTQNCGLLQFKWSTYYNSDIYKDYDFMDAVTSEHTTYRYTIDGRRYVMFNANFPDIPWKANTAYYIIPYDTKIQYFDKVPEDFDLRSRCNRKTQFRLRSSLTILEFENVSGDEDLETCENQIPTIVTDLHGYNKKGEQVSMQNLYFDWWVSRRPKTLSDEDPGLKATIENFSNLQDAAATTTLREALLSFRQFYPYKETLDGVEPNMEHESIKLTQAMIDLLREQVAAGQLLLRSRLLNAKVFRWSEEEPYFYFVAAPITTDDAYREMVNPDNENAVIYLCDEPQQLSIRVNDVAPALSSGFTDGMDGIDEYNYDASADILSIRLARMGQFQVVQHVDAEKADPGECLVIPLREAHAAVSNAIGVYNGVLTPVDNIIYLADTDDEDLFNELLAGLRPNTGVGELPKVGRIMNLYAVDKDRDATTQGKEKNYMRIYFFDTFEVKDGYTYTLKIPFRDYVEAGSESSNACDGDLLFRVKIVPDYEVWVGTPENHDWNNDANWRRADSDDLLLKADGYAPNTTQPYLTNTDNKNRNGFAPLYCTHVLIMTPNGEVYDKDAQGNDYKATDVKPLKRGTFSPELYDMYGNGRTENGTKVEYTDQLTHSPFPNLNPATATDILKYDFQSIPYNAEKHQALFDYGVAHENDLIAEMYDINKCQDIVFQTHTELLNAHLLNYQKAWVEFALGKNRWHIAGSPLQDVISGEWYAPSWSTRQESTYFEPIQFGDVIAGGAVYDDNGTWTRYDLRYDRFAPAVYQRAWDKAKAVLYEKASNWRTTDGSQTENLGSTENGVWNDERTEWIVNSDEYLERIAYKPMGNGKANVAIKGTWSGTYNDAAVRYNEGGFSIMPMNNDKPAIGDRDGKTGLALFRLPKEDAWYDSYDWGKAEGKRDKNSGSRVYIEDNFNLERPVTYPNPNYPEPEGGYAEEKSADNTIQLKNRGLLRTNLLAGISEAEDITKGKILASLSDTKEYTVTLTNEGGGNTGIFLASNPFICGLDMQKFLKENADNVEPYYLVLNDNEIQGDTTLTRTHAPTWSWHEVDVLGAIDDDVFHGEQIVKPRYAFFLHAKEGKDLNTLTIRYTTDMMARSYGQTEDDTPSEPDPAKPCMTIRAQRGGNSSTATVAMSPDYSNQFSIGEDMVTLIDEELAADIPIVYTVTGRLATSVNRLNSFSCLPLGVESNSDEYCTLSFTGVDNLTLADSHPSPATINTEHPTPSTLQLYDAYLETLTPIREGLQVRVPGLTQNRFFLVCGTPSVGVAESNIQIYGESGQVHVVSTTTTPLTSVRAYDTTGRLVYADAPEKSDYLFSLPKGVFIIEATTEKDRKVQKHSIY